MDISEILRHYPGVRIAGPQDNADILRFYDQQSMRSRSLSLQYSRSPDFFSLLLVRSEKSLVLVYESHSGQIEGVATFSFRTGYINGKLETVGYLGDLRLSYSRGLLRHWRSCYADLIRNSAKIPQMFYAKQFITSVMDENINAIRALVENKRSDLKYLPLAKYSMRNIFLKKPLKKLSKRSLYRIVEATAKDEPALIEFLNTQNRRKPFGYFFEAPFTKTIDLVKDPDGKIVGTVCLEKAQGKSTQVIYHSRILRALSHVHPRLPKSGTFIDFLYMSLLEVDFSLNKKARLEIASLLLEHSYQQFKKSGSHFLSYCEFIEDNIFRASKKFISFKKPMTLYTVTTQPLKLESRYSPGFEMASV